MYIKNIFNVQNYKGLEDGFSINFDDITYIIGDNAKNKTTIGSLPLWILTGYSMFGSNREEVSNDNLVNSKNTIGSMTIIDNNGTEHIITRCKGKENFVMLDEMRTTQEILAKFYKDTHAFICSYNPSYFRSMKLAEQKELLLKILPAISSQKAFELLNEDERTILEKPILNIKGYSKGRRASIKELTAKLNKIEGCKSIYINIATQQEENLKEFSKQDKLNEIESKYEQLMNNTDNLVSIEDLEKDITKISQKIKDNINIELQELKENRKKELEKLNNVSSETSICPTCKQEMRNENMISALKISYKKQIKKLDERIEELKQETKELLAKKNIQIAKYNNMKTPEMQEKTKMRNELKKQIEALMEEKSKVDLYNKEVSINTAKIKDARKQLEILNNETEKILNEISKYKKQLEIAKKLNLLIVKKQTETAKKYLNKVSIEFDEVDGETGEILEDVVYKIKYSGRDYEKLSKSYKLKADIEIARLISKAMDIQAPMFIDDVESITNIEFDSSIQIIISLVIKYNELEVLYSYQDVLEREKNSINKKIQENSNILQNVA